MTIEDGKKLSFEFHLEMSKQLITISSSMVGIIIAALRFFPTKFTEVECVYLPLIGLFLSVCFGIAHIGALAAAAENSDGTKLCEVQAVTNTARGQQLFFIGSMLFLGIILFPK